MVPVTLMVSVDCNVLLGIAWEKYTINLNNLTYSIFLVYFMKCLPHQIKMFYILSTICLFTAK